MPYSNHTVVGDPFGLTLPFKVAPLEVIEVADEVVTVGSSTTLSGVIVVSFTHDVKEKKLNIIMDNIRRFRNVLEVCIVLVQRSCYFVND